jgi:hypothetical protein
MKYVTKVVIWLVAVLYRVTGLAWLYEEIMFKVRAYRIRLNIVPVSYKLFILSLGILIGGSGVYVHLEAPEILSSINKPATYVYHNKPINVAKASEKPLEVKNGATEEVLKERSVEEIADYIWMKESTRGKNNYSKCEAIGKVNGIGYRIPGNGSYTCFESHDDEMTVLMGWIIDKNALGWSELKMLCSYSGNNYSECGKSK